MGSRLIQAVSVGSIAVDVAASDSGAHLLTLEQGKQLVVWRIGKTTHTAEVFVGPKGGEITVRRLAPLLSVDGDIKLVRAASSKGLARKKLP